MNFNQDIDHRRLGAQNYKSNDHWNSQDIRFPVNARRDEDLRLTHNRSPPSSLIGNSSLGSNQDLNSPNKSTRLSKPAQDLITTWKDLFGSGMKAPASSQLKRQHSPEQRPSRWSSNQQSSSFSHEPHRFSTKRQSRQEDRDTRHESLSDYKGRSNKSPRHLGRHERKDYQKEANGSRGEGRRSAEKGHKRWSDSSKDSRHNYPRSDKSAEDRQRVISRFDKKHRSSYQEIDRLSPVSRDKSGNGGISFSFLQKKDTRDSKPPPIIIEDEEEEDKLAELIARSKHSDGQRRYTSGGDPTPTYNKMLRTKQKSDFLSTNAILRASGFLLPKESGTNPKPSGLLPTPNNLLKTPISATETPKASLLPLPNPEMGNVLTKVPVDNTASSCNRVLLPLPSSNQSSPSKTETVPSKKVTLLSAPTTLLPLPMATVSSNSVQASGRKTLLPAPSLTTPLQPQIQKIEEESPKNKAQFILPNPDSLPSNKTMAYMQAIEHSDISVAVAKICNSYFQPGEEIPDKVMHSLFERLCICGATSSLSQLLQVIARRPRLSLLVGLTRLTDRYPKVLYSVRESLENLFVMSWHLHNVYDVFVGCFAGLKCWSVLERHLENLTIGNISTKTIHFVLNQVSTSDWSDLVCLKVCVHIIGQLPAEEANVGFVGQLWLACIENQDFVLAKSLISAEIAIRIVIPDVEDKITPIVNEWLAKDLLHLVVMLATERPDLNTFVIQFLASSFYNSKGTSTAIINRITTACTRANSNQLMPAELVLRVCRFYGNKYHWQSAQDLVSAALSQSLPLTDVCLSSDGVDGKLPTLLFLIEIALSSHQPGTVDAYINDFPQLTDSLVESGLAYRRNTLLKDLFLKQLEFKLHSEAANVFCLLLTIYKADTQPPKEFDVEQNYNQLICGMCENPKISFHIAQSTVKRVCQLSPNLRLQPLSLRLLIVDGVRDSHQPCGELLNFVDKALAVSIYRPIQPRSRRLAIPTDSSEEEILAMLLAYCRDLKDFLIQQMMSTEDSEQEDVLSLCELSISIYAVGMRDPEFIQRLGVDNAISSAMNRVLSVLDSPLFILPKIEHLAHRDRSIVTVDSFSLYNAVYHSEFEG